MAPYGVNMDADEFYKKLQQNEALKKQAAAALQSHCSEIKTDLKQATDFASAQETITEVYLALLSSFEGKSKEALTQRLAENANMLMDVLESRNKLLNSIKIK
ncbi:hypothetical protein P9G40_05610 [Bacillus velezensis]|uniref:hypothetical protein n=1 Tax=Bacillus amyloliquefaciens group TaxID=1938374 RepID=UPI000A3F48A0|nr:MULTISPECIES: hypothetical protein [Bacillus amyloliquefaciens group]MEC2150801.1 hypothetical protein [Bacillus velezensis]MEC2154645.1 hypothetical protein [Bacillus velezensis]